MVVSDHLEIDGLRNLRRHAKVVIEAWRREYYEERPKKSHGGLTPSAYAEQLVVKHDEVTSDSKPVCY